ncbi:MAG: hypothetical protein Aurels2KO_11230 [Aureliella sp.]
MDAGTARGIESLAEGLREFPGIHSRLVEILRGLPEDVQADFLSDATFRIEPERVTEGQRTTMFMACPIGRNVSRCVILRAKLENARDEFSNYVIAHELAHAFLRNGGWREYTDREEAADALAGHWGYPKPKRWF